jgi:hypothetical protein
VVMIGREPGLSLLTHYGSRMCIAAGRDIDDCCAAARSNACLYRDIAGPNSFAQFGQLLASDHYVASALKMPSSQDISFLALQLPRKFGLVATLRQAGVLLPKAASR